MSEIAAGTLFAAGLFIGMVILLELGWRIRQHHRLIDDKLAARVEAGCGPGEGKREQQTHEAEHGALSCLP